MTPESEPQTDQDVELRLVEGDVDRALDGETISFSHVVEGVRFDVTAEEIEDE